MATNQHWEQVYATKNVDTVSWFQPVAQTSLRLIQTYAPTKQCPILDVGAGASVLVDNLLASGYHNITLLDIAANALTVTRQRLREQAAHVQWIQGDILQLPLCAAHYGVWHDRAVFHFLTDSHQQQAYIAQVKRTLATGGIAIIATFATDGPTQCSDLPVRRYSVDALQAQFATGFRWLHHEFEQHLTPRGKAQHFLYGVIQRTSDG